MGRIPFFSILHMSPDCLLAIAQLEHVELLAMQAGYLPNRECCDLISSLPAGVRLTMLADCCATRLCPVFLHSNCFKRFSIRDSWSLASWYMLVRDLVGQTKSQFWYFKILWCLHLSGLMLHWCFPCNLYTMSLWVILKSIWRHHHHLQLCSKGALWVSTFATTLGCWPQTVDCNISSKWNESWRCGSRWQQWGWDDLAAAGWGVEEQPVWIYLMSLFLPESGWNMVLMFLDDV